MMNLFECLENLSEAHRAALLWFHDHRGEEVRWPDPMPNGTFLVNRVKGIHKPRGWRHALSIRQVLGSPYRDREPEIRSDGSWSYAYFQEGAKPEDRDRYFTNQALLACQRDGVPVGVLRQTRTGPARYEVLGLAMVQDWRDGYFFLQGVPSDESVVTDGEAENSRFRPASLEDARKRIMATIVQRRGQSIFRAELLRAYRGRCAVTGFAAIEALEAAHIVPYLGDQTNVVENGLLLRADIHTLFDLGLISIDASAMCVIVDTKLAGTEYSKLAGKRVSTPQDPAKRPSSRALKEHNRWAQLGVGAATTVCTNQGLESET